MALRFTRREKSISCSSRATVLAETSISSCRSSSAIPGGVLWVQRMPVMGSPAVLCSSRISMASITSGVFFHRFAPGAGVSDSTDLDILIQQLAAAAGDGVRIEAEKFSQHAVATVAEFHGFQTGIQAALLLIQQAIEQDNGGFHLIGRHFQTGGIDNRGNGLNAAPCQALSLAGDWIDGRIEEQAGDQLPGDPLLLDKVAQDVLRSNVEDRRQFFRKIPGD